LQIVAGPTFFSVSMGEKTSFLLLSHSQETKKPYILEFFHLLTKKWVWKSEENGRKQEDLLAKGIGEKEKPKN